MHVFLKFQGNDCFPHKKLQMCEVAKEGQETKEKNSWLQMNKKKTRTKANLNLWQEPPLSQKTKEHQ